MFLCFLLLNMIVSWFKDVSWFWVSALSSIAGQHQCMFTAKYHNLNLIIIYICNKVWIIIEYLAIFDMFSLNSFFYQIRIEYLGIRLKLVIKNNSKLHAWMYDALTQENFAKEVKSQMLGGLFEKYLYVIKVADFPLYTFVEYSTLYKSIQRKICTF